MGRGGESGGRGGESSAEIAETKEAPAAAELQSRVSPASVSGHRARHWARGQCILSVRAARAPAVGKLAPRVATGTPEPNGGGGSKIDSTVEITPSPNGVSARALGATPSSPSTPAKRPAFSSCAPSSAARLPPAGPGLFPYSAVFSASPFSCHHPTHPLPHPPTQQVGTLGDAVPTEQLQGERERKRERDGEGDAGGDGMGSSLSLAVPPGPLSFEALLAQVGALGGGQQLQLGLCCLPVLFVALGMASDPIFTLAPPLHCHYGAFAPNASGWEQPPNASGVSVASAALAASAASRIATSTDPSCSGFAPPDFNHCLKDWDYNGLPVLTTNAIGQVRQPGGPRVWGRAESDRRGASHPLHPSHVSSGIWCVTWAGR